MTTKQANHWTVNIDVSLAVDAANLRDLEQRVYGLMDALEKEPCITEAILTAWLFLANDEHEDDLSSIRAMLNKELLP